MGEALLHAHLDASGVGAHVHSAGTLAWGGGATAHAVAVVADRGLDLSAHASRQLDAPMVEHADLVLGMTRDHCSRVVALVPDAAERTFLVGELARLGNGVGPRRAGEPVRDWASRVAATRPDGRVVGRFGDEVDDPVGEPIAVYEATADRLDRDLRVIVRLLTG